MTEQPVGFSCKEEFEMWHAEQFYSITRKEHYEDLGVKAKWETWQAAWNARYPARESLYQDDLEIIAYGVANLSRCPEMAKCIPLIKDFLRPYVFKNDGKLNTSSERIQSLNISVAIKDIAEERQRQIKEERYSSEHDSEHSAGNLGVFGACYALNAASEMEDGETGWQEEYAETAKRLNPFDAEWFKPKNPRRDLVRAAALIIAEIEALDRKSTKIEDGDSNA